MYKIKILNQKKKKNIQNASTTWQSVIYHIWGPVNNNLFYNQNYIQFSPTHTEIINFHIFKPHYLARIKERSFWKISKLTQLVYHEDSWPGCSENFGYIRLAQWRTWRGLSITPQTRKFKKNLAIHWLILEL